MGAIGGTSIYPDPESCARLIKTVIDSLPYYVTIVDSHHKIVLANKAVSRALNKDPDALRGCYCPLAIHGLDQPYPGCPLEDAVKINEAVEKVLHDAKANTWMKSCIYPVGTVPFWDEPVYFHAIMDITGEKLLEMRNEKLHTELLQSQKMDALGRLASGIAHDFNNLITVLKGYTEIILDRMDSDDPNRKPVQEIERVGIHANELTRQLLDFSRKDVFNPVSTDLNKLTTGMKGMLERIIGRDKIFRMELGSGLGEVFVDPGRINQVILNLCNNASDAMEMGGKIIISTREIQLTDSDCPGIPGSRPGCFAILSVADEGKGIPREIVDKMFEPFFSTKDPGKGTGLGLSTVFEIVQLHHGWITVESRMGKGTVFAIYLPTTPVNYVSSLAGQDI